MKVFFTVCLFIVASLGLEAQTSIKIGFGVSDIAFKEGGQTAYLGYEVNSLTHKTPLFTYQLGVSREWLLTKRFSFMTDLSWVRKGLNYSTDYLYGDFKYRLILHYLEFPVLLKFKTGVKKNKTSGFFLGPYAGLLIREKLDRDPLGSYQVRYGSVNRLDPGVIAGYQSEFNMGNLRMFWDIRSGYSLMNMMQYVDHAILSEENSGREYARNVTVMLSIGYLLPVRTKNADP